jgi:hypothetical protein
MLRKSVSGFAITPCDKTKLGACCAICQRFCDHTMRQNKNLDQGGFQGEKYGRSGSEQGTGRAFSCGLARESQKAASDKNPACAPVTIAWL